MGETQPNGRAELFERVAKVSRGIEVGIGALAVASFFSGNIELAGGMLVFGIGQELFFTQWAYEQADYARDINTDDTQNETRQQG